jgi:hypothetical protein
MPPRRSERVAGAAERATSALSPLPLSVVLHIFSLLPVDCRLRCSEVCRGWRAVLLERSLWTRLDVSPSSGVRVRAGAGRGRGALDGLLRCAAARARGGVEALHADPRFVTHAALLEVAAANAGALRELHALDDSRYPLLVTAEEAGALCGTAPQLRSLCVDLRALNADVAAARRALRNEAPFGPLRVRHLRANFFRHDDAAAFVAFAADVAAHASLRSLFLEGAPLDNRPALEALLDPALACRLHRVSLWRCSLSSASAPALARLLLGGALTELEVVGAARLLDAPAAAVLAAALRASATLTSLSLNEAGVFDDAAATAELLGALHGHARLRALNLECNRVADDADRGAVGAALGALLAANTPALTQLDVSRCTLDDACLRPLFEALPRATHLRKLYVHHNDISAAFAADVLLPAVRANASLRALCVGGDEHAARAAEHAVDRRAEA